VEICGTEAAHGWLARGRDSKTAKSGEGDEESGRGTEETKEKESEERELFEEVTPLFSQRGLERTVKG
jgi:hypothetical protein